MDASVPCAQGQRAWQLCHDGPNTCHTISPGEALEEQHFFFVKRAARMYFYELCIHPPRARSTVEKRELERHYDAATTKTKGDVTKPTVGVVTQADAIQFVNALAAYATLPVLTPTAEFVLRMDYNYHYGNGWASKREEAEVRLYCTTRAVLRLCCCTASCTSCTSASACARSPRTPRTPRARASSMYCCSRSRGRVSVKKTVVPDKKPRITNVRGVVTKLLSGAVAPAPTPLASTTTMHVTPIHMPIQR
jgi:hypothetical protein